jgi:hypothetical protein
MWSRYKLFCLLQAHFIQYSFHLWRNFRLITNIQTMEWKRNISILNVKLGTFKKNSLCSYSTLWPSAQITQKLLLPVQLHNSTAHLLYKYCTNCTVCNWTVLTVITQKLLVHVQLHNSTQTLQMMSSKLQCSRLFLYYIYIDRQSDSIQWSDPSKKFKWLNTHCRHFTSLQNTHCHHFTSLHNTHCHHFTSL